MTFRVSVQVRSRFDNGFSLHTCQLAELLSSQVLYQDFGSFFFSRSSPFAETGALTVLSKELVAHGARGNEDGRNGRRARKNELFKRNVRPKQGAIWPSCRNGNNKKNERGRQTTRSRAAHEALNCHICNHLSVGLVLSDCVDVEWTCAKKAASNGWR